MKCILVTTNNTFKITHSDNFRELVDGYIEIVRPTAGYTDKLLLRDNVFVVDEEGHCKEKPLNYFGTLLYNGLFGPREIYPISGDIVIVGDSREDLRGLADKEIEYYKEVLEALKYREVS